jgi:hypothetical protein
VEVKFNLLKGKTMDDYDTATPRKTEVDPDDAEVLKRSTAEFAGVCDEYYKYTGASRYLFIEANHLNAVLDRLTSLYKNPTVYQRTENGWKKVHPN